MATALHQKFLDKSHAAMVAAIEVYNKPTFSYREETFCILAVNAWELLLKAKILKDAKKRHKGYPGPSSTYSKRRREKHQANDGQEESYGKRDDPAVERVHH